VALAVGCSAGEKGAEDDSGPTSSATSSTTGTDDDRPDGTTDSGEPVQDDYVDAVQAACAGGEDGTVALLDATRLESTVTWSLEFDSDAEAAGFVDCTYTRTYAGLQRVDIPHVCPGCDFIVEGDAVMTEGFADCYEPIFGGTETRTETWAIQGLDVHRRAGSQIVLPEDPLTTLETPSGDGAAVSLGWGSEYPVNDDVGELAGIMTLEASGTIVWETDPSTQLEEAFGPRAAAYGCGWECNDPGDLGGAYPLAPGAVLPNFRLDDQCGEAVDIHDFYGSYVVLDAAQSDCGPCLTMAEEAEAFRDKMTAEGIPVRLIPLLGNGLGDVAGTPSDTVHQAWVDRFNPADPVLADRGWGYAALSQYLPEHSGTDIAFPAWIVIGPDMTVIEGAVGFSSWDTIEAIIEADWVARGESGPL
jgi:hypothetical protein